MPRKNPLPESVRAVCARFREARDLSGMSGVEMARRCTLNPENLKGYEQGRAIVPYWVGTRIARESNVCQRWLATGHPPRRPFFPVDSHVETAIPKDVPFSVVYEAIIAPELNAWFSYRTDANSDAEESFARLGPTTLLAPEEEQYLALQKVVLRIQTDDIFDTFPPVIREAIMKDIRSLWERYHANYAREIARYSFDKVTDAKQRREENAVRRMKALRTWLESRGK